MKNVCRVTSCGTPELKGRQRGSCKQSRTKGFVIAAVLFVLAVCLPAALHADSATHQINTKQYNVLFIISDDLNTTALSCYGSKVCRTPNIDRLAGQGTLFSRAYCQFPVCMTSRVSIMFGYYPNGTDRQGRRKDWRDPFGDRHSWPQHFMQSSYHTARVSKIFHMGVPIDIEEGGDGEDDAPSWHERFNSVGPEWKARGDGETLENNLDGKKPVMGGYRFVVVEADGDDALHSDGKTAQKACELLKKYNHENKKFWLGVGFVRPHVPFVAPRKYFEPYAYEEMVLPKNVKGDWDDIPLAGINYKTSRGLEFDTRRKKKAMGAYFASVSYMDAQVGKLLKALKAEGLEDDTIVILTSDHGYHLGEHDFWAKLGLREESVRVPLIIKVPGKKAAVCDSFAELVDLYPTISDACGLSIPKRIQGKSLVKALDDPEYKVRDMAFSMNAGYRFKSPVKRTGDGFLLRSDRWAYIQYGEKAENGSELFDMHKDPKQYRNLAQDPAHRETVQKFKTALTQKLVEVRDSDISVSK